MAKKQFKVLVAEDDSFINKVYSKKLSLEGFEVIVVSDGEEAIRRIPTEGPDIILLDLLMPKKNGFEVLEAIKKSNKTKKIPVIILSNLGQEEDLEKGMELGANDYLVKSNHSIQEVVDKIKSELGAK